MNGGEGTDTLAMGAAAVTALYTSAADFGASGAFASGAIAAAGDTITGFTSGTDSIAVGSIVSGVGNVVDIAASGGAANFNTNGVVVRTGATAGDFIAGTSTYNDLAGFVNAAITTITGDAGDVGVIQFQDTTGGAAGDIVNVVVTLGTAAAARALNNTDSIAILSGVDAAAAAVTDFTFATA